MFDLIKSNVEFGYDCNIIEIVTAIVERSVTVSDYIMGTFTNNILQYRLGEDGFDSPKMEFFNKLIIHGKNRLFQFSDTVNNLIEKVTQERPRYNGCRLLVLHNIIENVVINLDKEAWKKILMNVLILFKDDDLDKKKFVKVRRLGVALVAFIFNTEPAINFFTETNSLDKVLKKILEAKKDLNTSYDRKVSL